MQNCLMNSYKIRLGSKSIEGQPSTIPHSVTFSLPSSSQTSFVRAIPTTATHHCPHPTIHLQNMQSAGLLTGMSPVPDHLSFNSAPMTDYAHPSRAIPNSHLPQSNISPSFVHSNFPVSNYHPYKPNFCHSEPLYAMRPTVYP